MNIYSLGYVLIKVFVIFVSVWSVCRGTTCMWFHVMSHAFVYVLVASSKAKGWGGDGGYNHHGVWFEGIIKYTLINMDRD